MTWPVPPTFEAGLAAMTPAGFASSPLALAFDPKSPSYGAVMANRVTLQGWWDAVMQRLVPFSREGAVIYVQWLNAYNDHYDYPTPPPADVADFFSNLPHVNPCYALMGALERNAAVAGTDQAPATTSTASEEEVVRVLQWVRRVGYLQQVGPPPDWSAWGLSGANIVAGLVRTPADFLAWAIVWLASGADSMAAAIGMAPPFGGISSDDAARAYHAGLAPTTDDSGVVRVIGSVIPVPSASDYLTSGIHHDAAAVDTSGNPIDPGYTLIPIPTEVLIEPSPIEVHTLPSSAAPTSNSTMLAAGVGIAALLLLTAGRGR